MSYTRVNWKNNQAGGTPLNATNLNVMDSAIADVDARVTTIETEGTASAISELKDVTLTSLANGQILEYDSSSSKWKNTDGGGLELANQSVAQSIANIVESPFNFAIQNGVYGYIKSEGGADTFCPFSSGTAYEETTLMDNQQISSTSDYLYPTITDDLLNYDYIKFVWKKDDTEYITICNNTEEYSDNRVYYLNNHNNKCNTQLIFDTTKVTYQHYSGSYYNCYLSIIGYKEEE